MIKIRQTKWYQFIRRFLFPAPSASRWRRALPYVVVVGLVAAAALLGIAAWEISNSNAFCGNVCHDIMYPYIVAYDHSTHVRVDCVECHMGRTSLLDQVPRKFLHVRELYALATDSYPVPLVAHGLRPAQATCELCHYPPQFFHDTVREERTYKNDEENTPVSTWLILKTGGGLEREGQGFGIHWHIENEIYFYTTDEQYQEIPWMRVVDNDGNVTEYAAVDFDPPENFPPEEDELHLMDCIDCHNRTGHQMLSPEQAVDQALHYQQIPEDLPYIRERGVTLLGAGYDTTEEALEAIEGLSDWYAENYPDVHDRRQDEIDGAIETLKSLYEKNFFPEAGYNWRSQPDDIGHTDFPGCFRCHDGTHMNDEGESVRLHCNICHSIPVVVESPERPPEMPVAYIQEPTSHLEPNFIADHRFQASEECSVCHGEIEFGADDSSFCANSACHGRTWPEVDLNAAFPHPFELEGAHQEAWCHDCHNGVRQPAFECDNCHEPPMEPHFGPVCEDCHTPEGWAEASVEDFEHPVALEDSHAELACSDCHSEGEELTYDCVECHEPPADHFGETCEDCHTPTAFTDATLPPELHPVPLIGAHQRATCSVCHAEGQRVPEYVCTNCHQAPPDHLEGACDDCHSPEGWEESVSRLVSFSSTIPHELEGREDCLLCHDPEGDIQPAPGDHADRINEQCTLCHKLDDEAEENDDD